MNKIKSRKLSRNQEKIIENIMKYIAEKREALNTHYLSVKTKTGQNKNNDIYDSIDINAFNHELMKISVVILTANYYECEILNLNIFNDSGKKIKQLNCGLQLLSDWHIVKAYIFEIGGYNVLHLHAPETGSNTPCGSADLVRYVGNCKFLEPSCIVSFGICYGTDYENFSLGDTLIAEKIYPWSIGIKISNNGWKIKCDDYVIDLRNINAQLYSKIKETIDSTQNLCPNQKVVLGNMLTSEAVVSNEKVKIEAINRAFGCNIIGGEMEGYGLAKECIYYNQTPCIILKAICDWGAIKNIDEYISEKNPDIKKTYKDQIQAYTTYCAYRVLNELFKNKVFEKNNTIAAIHEAISTKYYSDISIRKKVFDNFLEEYLKTNYKKYKVASEESRICIKQVVTNNVINEYFSVCADGACYVFNEFLY